MSKIYFISDLHLGHKNILKFSPERVKCMEEQGYPITVEGHDAWLIASILSTITKRDILYILGDIIFSDDYSLLENLSGYQVRFMLGNHDDVHKFLEFCNDVYWGRAFERLELDWKVLPSLYKYKKFWLSHCPIHPDELRDKRNIHGHVHSNSIKTYDITEKVDDPNYINVCVEAVGGKPISLQEIINR